MQPTQHTIPTPYPVGPVHCYSLELNGELILFDTGPATAETREYLRANLDLQKLKHVLITHCHIDHYGQAAWLEQEYGARVYLPYRDGLKITRHGERLDGMTAVLGEIGFEQTFMDAFRADMDSESVFPDFPQQYHIAEDELPATLEIQTLPCPGHSQSDLVYVGDSWAVTGDTMLREIFQSPLLDIDLVTGERFRNYEAYCETIVRLATLREKQILPGHRRFIHGVDFNLCFYTGKLLERAQLTAKFPKEVPAPEVVTQLIGAAIKEPFLLYLKASEIVFIRDFLATPETLRMSLEKIGLYPQLASAFELATGG